MTAASFGLLATARYLPRLRLDRGEMLAQHRWMAPGLRGLAKGQRTLANWDEDAVTMAVEAARLLHHEAAGAVQGFSLVSTGLPFAERLNAGIAAAALQLPPDALVRDVAGGARSALTELATALRAGTALGSQLVVAAENRTARPASAQEMLFGDGAAAALVGRGSPVAALVAHTSRHADLVDHFRATGQPYDYGWEERWVRDEAYMKLALDTIKACLAAAGVAAADVAHFALPAPVPKVNEAVARRLGLPPEAVVPTDHEQVGDLGSAQPLAMLDRALRRALPGQHVLVAAFSSGCDALLLRRSDSACPGAEPAAGKTEKSYLKLLSFSGQLALEWGMRAEMDNKTALTAAWRDHERTAHFEAGHCKACGTVQFPRSAVCVNPACHAQGSQAGVSLVDRPARVMSHTSDFLAYTPHPPFQFGHISFDGGGRVLMEFADTDADELKVGLPVRMVYRIKDIDRLRGYRRYFWKATPVRSAQEAS